MSTICARYVEVFNGNSFSTRIKCYSGTFWYTFCVSVSVFDGNESFAITRTSSNEMVVITTNKSIQFTHAKRSKSSVYTESKRSKEEKKTHSESNISLVYFILLLSYRILSYHVVSYRARSILLLRKLCHFYFICLNSLHSQCTNTHIHKHIAHTHTARMYFTRRIRYY